jgi:hypothetical protein
MILMTLITFMTYGARKLTRPAGLVSLAAGALCLVAACGTVATSPPKTVATGVTATPTQSATPVSSPTTQSQPTTPPTSPPANGTVTAAPASSAQVAELTAAAGGHCGFTSAADTLTDAKVTNNGWASATITARNPQDQGNASMVFRLGGTWTYDTCGSSFINDGIPQDVLNALNP